MSDMTNTPEITMDDLADLELNEIVGIEEIAKENLSHELEEKILNIVEMDELIQAAREKAKKAQQKAKGQTEPGWFKNRKAIESTQSAVVSLAEVQTDISDSQVLLYENQKRMSDGMKFLLGLGVTNLTYNSMVIRTLYNKLKNTPPEEMSEMAREELKQVVKQLLQQRTILQKQEQLDQKLFGLKKHDKEQDGRILENSQELYRQSQKSIEHDKQIEEIILVDRAQENRISENSQKLFKQARKDAEHDEKLKEIALLDKAQDALISEIKGELQRLFELLSVQERMNTEQSDLLLDIRKNAEEKEEELDQKIRLVSEKVAQTECRLKGMWWKIAVSAVAASSLVLSLLQILGILY